MASRTPWVLPRQVRRAVPVVDEFKEYAALLYPVCPKSDSSRLVASGNIYDCSKLAPEIKALSKGIFGDSFVIKMPLTREGE